MFTESKEADLRVKALYFTHDDKEIIGVESKGIRVWQQDETANGN